MYYYEGVLHVLIRGTALSILCTSVLLVVVLHVLIRYGFEYEYVEYKWPRWLNQQAEKQRKHL